MKPRPTLTAARRALLLALLALDGQTVDVVHERLELPPDKTAHWLGGVSDVLVRKGIIRADVYRKSMRRIAHGRPITLWRLVDRVAALDWLTAHPEMPTTPVCEVSR